jgi:hypothetical protein
MGNSPITYDITRNKYRFNNIRVISNRGRTSTFQPAAGTKRRADAPVPRGKAMLTVHHLNNSRSQRVLWLLEELGVPYEIIRYQRQPDMRAPA